MPIVNARCERCGAAVTLDLPPGLEDLAVVGATCQACADRQVEERGGVVLELAQLPPGALFQPGRITVTGGAVAALGECGQHALDLLRRHLLGDWGENGRAGTVAVTAAEVQAGPLITDDDAKQNELALLTRSCRIISAYRTARGRPVWVITDFWPGVPETTVLLPDEY